MRITTFLLIVCLGNPVLADMVEDLKLGLIKSCIGCDLRDINFKKIDLSYVNFSNSNIGA